jgi:hypothetical protein
VEPVTGVEPAEARLRNGCPSTRATPAWRRRRDSNPLQPAWKAGVQPHELRLHGGPPGSRTRLTRVAAPHLTARPVDHGGAKGGRTPDLLRATQALFLLSYGPNEMAVGAGLEPATSWVTTRRCCQTELPHNARWPVAYRSTADHLLVPPTGIEPATSTLRTSRLAIRLRGRGPPGGTRTR